MSAPTKGTVAQIYSNTIEWIIDEFGVNQNGACTGITLVNERLDYSDAKGDTTNSPNPFMD